jgi:tRNA(Ile)-lysidine synthase
MKTDEPILAKMRRTIVRHGLIRPGDKVLVACSGGPDSTVLLHLLLELRVEMPFEIAVAHFNHRLRPAAGADAAFVRATAARLGLPCIVQSGDVRAFSRARKLNLEEAGRILRYEFLREAAARTGATKIATGHTLDDQAETVLIRLLRGSGPRGLSGIHPVVDGIIIRPLLDVRRKEIEAYGRTKRLAFRRDATNFDPRYVRNRIRLRLMPYLEKHFDKTLAPKLGRTAEILRDEDGFFEEAARRTCRRLIVRRDGRTLLDVRRLARLSRALARRCVRIFLRELKGDLRKIDFEDIESVRELGPGAALTLPDGLALRRDGDLLGTPVKQERKADYLYLWDGQGRLPIPGAESECAGRRIKPPRRGRPAFDDETSAYCDAAALRFPLLVRTRRDGDLYRPCGAPGRKKLKEILRAKRIPASERDTRPVFCSGERIVWMPGLRVAEEFKVTGETKEIFVIRTLKAKSRGAALPKRK